MRFDDVVFLEVDDILEVHAESIRLWGGSAGIRDFGRLVAAVARPRSGFGDTLAYPSLARMAAAMLHGIAQGHAFVDGNKRAATAGAFAFMRVNGFDMATAKADLWERIVLGVADGTVTLEDLAGHFASEMGGDVDVDP